MGWAQLGGSSSHEDLLAGWEVAGLHASHLSVQRASCTMFLLLPWQWQKTKEQVATSEVFKSYPWNWHTVISVTCRQLNKVTWP